MSQEHFDRLDSDPGFRQKVLEEVNRGVEELRIGDCIELDDDGLTTLLAKIEQEGREELGREQLQSSPIAETPAADKS